MIYYLILINLFINVVLSLRCKTAWPPNCIYNSTCIYNTTECLSSPLSSNSRGGTYCTTIIKKIDEILVGRMDCMYDQETSKICKNQTECSMKYTNDQKQFLHCCCDQDFCNLNFTLSDIDRPIPPNTDFCKGLLCKPIYIIILCFIIGLIILLIIISFIYRNKLLKSFEKCGGLINKNATNKSIIQQENDPLILNSEQLDQRIDFNHLIIGNIVKRGRFSTIHQAIYNNNRVAIKILIDQNQTDEPRILFEHEKQIYSLPFMTHTNILKYYGYSKCVDKLCIITELSENGSLRDVLRSRLLKDKNELILILKEISDGLQYLHSEYRNDGELIRPSIAHRDFKSENILYLNENRLVICDFAMSTKLEQNENGPNQEQQIGTPRYMSPEILAGTIGCGKDALLQCDVYALGIIFWEVLSRYPFQDSNENYNQPFEKQLMENNLNVNNPSVNDMLRIMILPNPSNRPLINELWRNCNKSWINQIISTMEECWDQTPEARISSALAARRIQQLTN